MTGVCGLAFSVGVPVSHFRYHFPASYDDALYIVHEILSTSNLFPILAIDRSVHTIWCSYVSDRCVVEGYLVGVDRHEPTMRGSTVAQFWPMAGK